MTKNQWKDELRKYLYLLPVNDQRDIYAYYDELFNDFYDRGLSDDEIIDQLGSPKETAKKLVADFMDDHEDIERSEKIRQSGESASSRLNQWGQRIQDSMVRLGDKISEKASRFSEEQRKRRTKLDSDEARDYEREIDEERRERARQRRRAEEQQAEEQRQKERRMREEEERSRADEARDFTEAKRSDAAAGDKFKKENKTMDKTLTYEKVERVKDKSGNEYVRIEDHGPSKTKFYTQSQRKSFVANLFYIVFMIIFIALGVGLAWAGARSVVVDAIFMARTVAKLDIINSAADLANLGLQILSISGGLIVFAIGFGIVIGCIRKIHKRFFVKQYILRKAN